VSDPNPELDALARAFEAGNFARVREGVPRLLASSADPEVKRAAQDLLARTRPDPLAGLFVALTAVLLAALSAWWIFHDRPG
jgi:hypothetical protein